MLRVGCRVDARRTIVAVSWCLCAFVLVGCGRSKLTDEQVSESLNGHWIQTVRGLGGAVRMDPGVLKSVAVNDAMYDGDDAVLDVELTYETSSIVGKPRPGTVRTRLFYEWKATWTLMDSKFLK